MAYTKDFLLDVLKQADEKLGRLPTRRELRTLFGITEKPYMREFNSWAEAGAHYVAVKRAAESDELVILSGISEDILYDDIIKAEQGQADVDAALKTYMQGTVKVMTLSDIEVPYANLKMINHAVRVALEQGVKIVVLNGDITHSDFFSKHAKDTYVSPAEEYQQLEQLVAFFSSKFEQVILVRGNHDDMVERFCQRHFGLEHMKFLVRYDLLANVADNYDNVTYANNWWTKIGDAVYGHPYNYSSIPMRTALIAAGSVARFADFKAFFMGHCFSSDTELLTPEGWKLYTDLNVGSRVATMSKETRNIEFQPVLDKFVYDSYKSCLHFKNRSVDHLVTSDHGMIAETRKGDLVEFKAKDWPDTELYVRVAGKTTTPDNSAWSHDEISLLVQCITDGALEQGKYWRWHLKKQRKINRLRELLQGLGIPFTETLQKSGTTKFYVGDLPAKFTKSLTAEVLSFSSSQLQTLLQEWSITDGTLRDTSAQLQTNNKDHADILSAACVLSGNKGTVSAGNGMFYVSVRFGVTRTRATKSCKLGEVPYSGDVFCVSVDNGTLVARRNGKPVVTQNTHQVGSIIVDGVYHTETGCSCNMQGYAFKRVQKTRWVNAFNISEFVDGKIQFNEIRNYIHGTAPI